VQVFFYLLHILIQAIVFLTNICLCYCEF